MKQEDKELLLKDLCSRLPYKTEIQVNEWAILTATLKVGHISRLFNEDLDIKPYLFPLSSMTEEQKTELNDTLIQLELKALNDEIEHHKVAEFEIDFYNKNMFDYRGLIDKELALDATNKNIY